MSFRIFSLQITGKIKPVSHIEKKRAQLESDYSAFRSTESSDELKAFIELENWINSDSFKNKKKETESLTFKGSKEENELKEFAKLKKSGPIRKYFKVEGSGELNRFEKERESDKIKKYYVLLDFVKEGQFEKEKKEIKAQVFKGSVEEKHQLEYRKLAKSAGIKAYLELEGSEILRKHEKVADAEKLRKYLEFKNAPLLQPDQKSEFKKLKSDAELKAYFRFERSKKLKFYRETAGSHNLTRHSELKTLLASAEFKTREAFLKDSHKFEKSEAFAKYSEFKKLAADESIKFVLKYEKSALYKNYLDVKDSFDLKRFHELETLIQSDEFKQRKAWLDDKKRWEKTEEHKKYQKYVSEKGKPEFVNYFKYKSSNAFDCFTKRELIFEDNFSGKSLDLKKWSTSTAVAGKLLGENYALPGDLNIFTAGENLRIDHKLIIQVKKEKAKGKVWKMPAGFVPTDFEYTSGLISTLETIRFTEGILEAKIKFDPAKQVISSVYLEGEKAGQRVNLLEMGARNHVGTSKLDEKGKVQSSGLDISNLKKGEYIFTLEKEGSSLAWKINEVEVLKEEHSNVSQSLHLQASVLVIDEVPASALPLNMEISWVKCYARK